MGATLAVVFATGGLVAALVSVLKDFPWQRRTVGVVEPRLEEALNAVEQLLERDLGHELRGAVRAELKAPMEKLRRSGFHTTVWASVGSALLGVLGAELVRWFMW